MVKFLEIGRQIFSRKCSTSLAEKKKKNKKRGARHGDHSTYTFGSLSALRRSQTVRIGKHLLNLALGSCACTTMFPGGRGTSKELSEIEVATGAEVDRRMQVAAAEEEAGYSSVESFCEVDSVPVHVLRRIGTLWGVAVPTSYGSIEAVSATSTTTSF
jgi:hypothetical protein